MRARLGEHVAQSILDSAIRQAALEAGQSFAAKTPGEVNLRSFQEIQDLWTQDDALTAVVVIATDKQFHYNVTRCRYAEAYHQLGLGHIGHLLSCNRDFVFPSGYNPDIKLKRTQTIMEGAPHCDFEYSYEPAAPDASAACGDARPVTSTSLPEVASAASDLPSVDRVRLWADLMYTARFGSSGDTGMKRLAFSEADQRVREWFRDQCQALGCTVETDCIGNMFATYPGTNATLNAIAVGSHLDTQPGGGRFDGILGVLAGIEVIRTLKESGLQLLHPFTVVNWANEEGCRFSPAMMGSGVFCGALDRDSIEGVSDRDGITVRQALEDIGFRGELPPGHRQFTAYLELHIEQGPILEANSRDIGVVTGIQGICWLDIHIKGTEAHAGSQPMGMRQDALVRAARLVQAVEALAHAYSPGVATVGFSSTLPNSRNVVPGQVRLGVDMRHPVDDELSTMEEKLLTEIELLAPGTEVTRVWRKPPVVFTPNLNATVRREAERYGLSAMELVSGGGHDAGHVASAAPTTMIFIPSKDGLSHNEREFSSPEQCAAGADVLLATIIDIDKRIAADNEG
jgi:N-carbamoyl-L-amino-acid hydrolase